MDLKRIIPIGMISDDNFIMPTCVAVTSMICNKSPETSYIIYILMAECSEESKKKLIELDTMSDDCEIKLIEVGLEKYRNFKQLAHISIACLLKFDICDLIPEYDKILYLDGDILVKKDLWELYNTDIEGKYAAAVQEPSCIKNNTGNINAGIMLFNAKRIREEQLSEKLYQTRLELGDRPSMDQQTFNIVTGKDYKYLSIKYNYMPGYFIKREGGQKYPISKINHFYKENYRSMKELEKAAYIVHFASKNKPWEYNFNHGAKEWYAYYLLSPFQNIPLEWKSRWKYRLDKMHEAWRNNGVKGVAGRVVDKVKRSFGIRGKGQSWE